MMKDAEDKLNAPPEEPKSVFTNIRINLLDHDIVKATASCKVADMIYLTGMRVIHGKHGRFVSMPATKDSKGEFRDVFFPSTKEARDELMELVLQKYDEQLSQ
jgi:stage V sporulation protein G